MKDLLEWLFILSIPAALGGIPILLSLLFGDSPALMALVLLALFVGVPVLVLASSPSGRSSG